MELTIPDQHELRIARKTMLMNCTAALVMGGPNHSEAVLVIHRLTGKVTRVDAGCKCVVPDGSKYIRYTEPARI